MAHYSGYDPPRCGKCGQTEITKLTIDHIYNDGSLLRKIYPMQKRNICKWLKINNFPLGYQVLCLKCNEEKRRDSKVYFAGILSDPQRKNWKLILDNKVSLRDKAFFLVVASAGFRLGTALSLQVKDYKPIKELGIITVKGAEGRKLAIGKSYFTFITPEARRILEEYLKTRGTLNPDASLFAKESKGIGKQFDYCSNVSRQWTILVKRAKLLEKAANSRNFTLHGHSLRKFFQTHCKLAGCRADFVDFWMGHHPTGSNQYLNDSYFRPDLQTHIEEYRKAVSHLQVFEQDTKKLSELEKDMEALKLQNFNLKNQLETIISHFNLKDDNPEASTNKKDR